MRRRPTRPRCADGPQGRRRLSGPMSEALIIACLFSAASLRASHAGEVAASEGPSNSSARALIEDSTIVHGAHGGVVGLPPGSYVCVLADDARDRCILRAIDEQEIVLAIAEDEGELDLPAWMNTMRVRRAAYVAPPGLPESNEYRLPGLMTLDLDPRQVALVRCLANSQLGRPLFEWHDASVYARGIVARCEAETHGAGTNQVDGALPLAPRHLQEAVAIASAAQRVADANMLYANFVGQYAGSAFDLTSGAVMAGLPPRTASMDRHGVVLERGNRLYVDLKPEAVDVCRALNLLHGRIWSVVPTSLPDGALIGCHSTARGFRFEYRP